MVTVMDNSQLNMELLRSSQSRAPTATFMLKPTRLEATMDSSKLRTLQEATDSNKILFSSHSANNSNRLLNTTTRKAEATN
jgi:hypothetical protein